MNTDVKRLIREAVAAVPPPPMGDGGYVTSLGVIQQPNSPITSGRRFWPFIFARGHGPETEGATCVFPADGEVKLYAVNLGSKNPVVGDIVLVHNVGGYWFFAFHGPPPGDD